MRRALASLVVMLSLSGLAGCGASAVPQEDVEQKVLKGLKETAEEQIDEVTCPGDLPAEVDAEMMCELRAEGGTYDVTVTVTSVDGRDVEFDYDVKNAVPAEDVESRVVVQLTEKFGQAPDDVACPEDLPAEVGAEVVCVFSAGEDTIDVTATVTSAENGRAEFDIQVADEFN